MKQYKSLGIGLTTLLVLGVVVLTFAEQKKSNNLNVAADTANILPAPAAQGTSSGGIAASAPAPTPTRHYFFGGDDGGNENENEYDGEDGGSSAASSTTTTAVTSVPASTSTKSSTSSSVYKDGTYSLTASYESPGGMDKLGVSVTIAGGTVTATSVTPEPGNRTSARYENNFAANYKSSVIGKSIASLSIGRVAGASLTTASFNQALAAIRTQAKG